MKNVNENLSPEEIYWLTYFHELEKEEKRYLKELDEEDN
jgi:hypothetical protein